MQADILAWAVPATFLTFGIGFALLGRIGAGLYAWSGCFCLAALAYALTVIPTPPGAIAKPLFEDSLFLLALSGANVAFASRAGRRPRYGVIAAIVGASLLGAYLALRLTGSAQFEIFSIQAGCSLLMLLAATTIRRRSGRMMDQVLFWLCILVAASLGLQNLVFLSTPLDQPMTVANWRDSPWAFVFQFSGAVTGVLIAFAILAAIGLDVIEHHRTSSDMDALTLVRNRRGFERRVAELRRAAGPLAPGAIILADLDFFKRINDRHGHEAGDAVLCGFATLLERMVGTRGCVCRFGGEEFAVFLASSDLAGAQVFAQSLQSALRAVRWPFALADLRVTASFGVVALAPGEHLWDAASRADTLLYVAKSHGRDRVIADAIAPASAPARTAFAPAS